jgi:hypothetical protein
VLELSSQLVEDGARAPAGVGSAEFDDAGLDLGRDLVGAAIRLGALVGQRPEALGRGAHQPAVEGPAIDPLAERDVFDLGPRVEHLSDREIALLNHVELHKHWLFLLGSAEPRRNSAAGWIVDLV